MLWEEVSYEILDYETKLLQNQTSTFLSFPLLAWAQFSEKYIYVKETLLIYFDWYLILLLTQ